MSQFTKQEDLFLAHAVGQRVEFLMRRMQTNRENVSDLPDLADHFQVILDLDQIELDTLVSAMGKVSAGAA